MDITAAETFDRVQVVLYRDPPVIFAEVNARYQALAGSRILIRFDEMADLLRSTLDCLQSDAALSNKGQGSFDSDRGESNCRSSFWSRSGGILSGAKIHTNKPWYSLCGCDVGCQGLYDQRREECFSPGL